MNKLIFSVFFVGLATVALGWLSSRSTLFRLSSVEVNADNSLVANNIKNSLAGYLGSSLFALPLSEIEESLRQDIRILDLRLRKRWPSTIRVDVSLRKPLYKSSLRKEVAFDQFAEAFELPLVEIEGLPVFSGKIPAFEKQQMARWLFNLSEQSTKEYRTLRKIEWKNDRGLEIETSLGSFKVLLGFDHFEQAWSRAASVIQALSKGKENDLISLDASYQQRVLLAYVKKLQNSANSLNLKELVRREAFGASQTGAR